MIHYFQILFFFVLFLLDPWIQQLTEHNAAYFSKPEKYHERIYI